METFRVTRLAPSPTGALHLGHARTFLITWWLARQMGAKIHMRMDDIDAIRAKPESVQQAYDDLRWLGIEWDAYTTNQTEVVQSNRNKLYFDALNKLWQTGAIYPCICKRAEIAASASAPHDGEGHPRYPGTCRERFDSIHAAIENVGEVAARVFAAAGRWPCFRLRVAKGHVDFHDEFVGEQSLDVYAEAGDFPVTRFAEMTSEGLLIPPAYQLACVVDDHAMGVDCVIRGDDLLPSTPRQILVNRALDNAIPKFIHVPLVIGADGKRLAKRHGESRIAQFREAGVSAERVVGWVAWRSGQIDHLREISASEIVSTFELRKLPRKRLVLGPEDLAWLR